MDADGGGGKAAFGFAERRQAWIEPVMRWNFLGLVLAGGYGLLLLAGCAGGPGSSDGNPGPGDARRAYYNTPQYQQEQPFAYDEPIVDDFYDSSYEESLYSPFSFN